jgi:hypothetical protein
VALLLPHEVLARGFALFLLANAVFSWLRAPAGSSPRPTPA